MKSKLLIAMAALVATSVSYAETITGEHSASGEIDLTLALGDSGGATQGFIAEANLHGGSNSVNLETELDEGKTELSIDIGSMSFIGEDLEHNEVCQVKFTGSNSPVSNFYQLFKTGGTDADSINYIVKLSSFINSETEGNDIQDDDLRPNSVLTVNEVENMCSIYVTNIIIHSDDDLTDKNGVYTDTLTYTMTAI